MGFFSKDEKSKIILLRGIKTFFFLIYMLFSFLLFSAPVLLVIADTLIPSAFLFASLAPTSFSLRTLYSHLQNYDFRYTLIDIPLISIIRSAIILCVYSLCDGPRLSRGPYLTTATICSVSSILFVSLKASYLFDGLSYNNYEQGYVGAMEIGLFMCSWILAIGHIVVAYRTSCRERRKLLVYKIDIEAVSLCKKGYPRVKVRS